MIFPLAYIDNLDLVANAPTASFLANREFLAFNETLTLADTSTGNPTAWKWYLNGVFFSTNRFTSVSLPRLGIYRIRLEVSNAYGSDSVEQIVEGYNSDFRQEIIP